MSQILIVDAGLELYNSKGLLCRHYTDVMTEELTKLGHSVVVSHVADPYDIAAEGDKVMAADILIFQIPGMWMDVPWVFKRWEDEVLTSLGGRLFTGDGRHREEPAKNYGNGGIDLGKRYMISSTWNAPIEAFTVEGDHFDGRGIDAPFYSLIKAMKFMGMYDKDRIESFISTDVVKNPQIETDTARLREHIRKHFAAA